MKKMKKSFQFKKEKEKKLEKDSDFHQSEFNSNKKISFKTWHNLAFMEW
jgi:hypothetical protein